MAILRKEINLTKVSINMTNISIIAINSTGAKKDVIVKKNKDNFVFIF
jgi:hypothetical protein